MTTETKRRPGRPRQHDWEPGRIEVRLDPELRRQARHAAIDDSVSLSEWVVRLIAAELERRRAAQAEPGE